MLRDFNAWPRRVKEEKMNAEHLPGELTKLVIFVRLPRPVCVKTRLAASVGPEEACSFYAAMAENIVLAACRSEGMTRTHAKLGWFNSWRRAFET